jgi:hypothetical protein
MAPGLPSIVAARLLPTMPCRRMRPGSRCRTRDRRGDANAVELDRRRGRRLSDATENDELARAHAPGGTGSRPARSPPRDRRRRREQPASPPISGPEIDSGSGPALQRIWADLLGADRAEPKSNSLGASASYAPRPITDSFTVTS